MAHKRLSIGAGLVAAGLLLAAPLWSEDDPAAEKFRRLAELAAAPSEETRQEAQQLAEELAAMGTDALAMLREALGGGPTEQGMAIYFIGNLGPDAVPAVPELLVATGSEDPNVRRFAAQLLGPLDPSEATIARLTEMLRDEELTVVSDVCRVLGEIGPAAAAAVPAIIAAGRHPGWGFATWMGALGGIRAQPELSVPALVWGLGRGYPETAARALGELGTAARPAVPALLSAMEERLAEDLESDAHYLRALQLRDPVFWALAQIYQLEEGDDVTVTIERLLETAEEEHRERLSALATRLGEADLVDVVIEVQELPPNQR